MQNGMLFIVFTSALVLAIVSFVFSRTVVPAVQAAKMKKRLLRQGVEADAVLLNIEQTGLYVSHRPRIKLQVQVHPSAGRNFVSEVQEVLTPTDLSRLRIGSTVRVRYNPANHKEITVLHQGSFGF